VAAVLLFAACRVERLVAAPLRCGGAQSRNGKKMSESSPKPFAELVQLAREHATAVSEQERQSLPVPVKTKNGHGVAFFFVPAFVRPREAAQLRPPVYLVVLSTDGGVVESQRVAPAFFGQSQNPADIIGTFGLPEGWTFETYMKKYARLLECLEILMPFFAAGAASLPGDKKPVAQEYRTLQAELMEPPLELYYHAIGSDFFLWVKRVAS
jgi:hypothetical protein